MGIVKSACLAVEDTITGVCMQHGGNSECPKYPNVYPSPCCWVTCDSPEACNVSCWNAKGKYGKDCKWYRSNE